MTDDVIFEDGDVVFEDGDMLFQGAAPIGEPTFTIRMGRRVRNFGTNREATFARGDTRRVFKI